MKVVTKTFEQLNNNELFEIFSLRVSVFVVEQNCAYQEIDEYDRCAYHVYMADDKGIAAYLRVLPQNTRFATASIGRVIARERNKGYGTAILNEGIKVAKDYLNADRITIEAQTYAKKLYENAGFVQISDEFLEDGIPHITMELIL